MDNSRNTMLALGLSLLVLLAWQYLYVNPRLADERRTAEIQQQQQQQQQQQRERESPAGVPTVQQPDASGAPAANVPRPEGQTAGGTAPDASPALPAGVAVTREAALAAGQRVKFENGDVIGSINVKGARIDDLRLKKYRVTVDPRSDLVTLLSPASLPDGYFAELGFVAGEGQAPGPDTVWKLASGGALSPASPVTLEWTSDAGVTFSRRIEIDDQYLFTYTDTVTNGSSAPVTVSPYGRVTRFSKPDTRSAYVLHEGLIGYFGEDGGLEQVSYSSIEDDREFTTAAASGGWLGITDKYWAAALVPQGQYKPRFSYFDDGRVHYQSDFLGDPIVVAAGQSASVSQQVFAGAKEVDIIDGYEEVHGIERFELLIDWGWFYFLTKPTFYLLDWLYRLVGNFGVAILMGTVLIKAALFPLANMSYKSMANMKKLQPEMQAMRERYADDKVKMQQEIMALYKKEKINPAAGCWPVLVQIPIFFSLYKVLYITIEMRHAPFFGWIHDLAAPDPTSVFNLFGLLPFDAPTFLPLGIWPLIMGITMFLQMQMNPAPPDPTQAMIFKWMPIVFTFMLASFPAGLVIYWAWNNSLSIVQQGVIMKRQGAKIELWDNLVALFRKKPKPAE